MPRITASLEERQYDHVEAISDELDESLAEVMRRLIDAHQSGDVQDDALDRAASRHDAPGDVLHYDEVEDRITDLEQRVDELEQQSIEPQPEPTVVREPEPPQEAPEPDVPVLEREGGARYESNVVEFVRVNQPVSKSDILDHCTPDDFPGKPESWWTRHGQDELKDAGGTHTRNRGWSIEDEGE